MKKEAVCSTDGLLLPTHVNDEWVMRNNGWGLEQLGIAAFFQYEKRTMADEEGHGKPTATQWAKVPLIRRLLSPQHQGPPRAENQTYAAAGGGPNIPRERSANEFPALPSPGWQSRPGLHPPRAFAKGRCNPRGSPMAPSESILVRDCQS